IAFLAVPFVSVILMGILWKRTNYAGAMFGTIGGAIIAVLATCFYLIQNRFGFDLHRFYVAFFAELVIIAGIVVVSLATPAPPPAQWEPFLWRPSLLKVLKSTGPRPWYRSLRLW